jgi:hypothetical protein
VRTKRIIFFANMIAKHYFNEWRFFEKEEQRNA